MPRLRLILGVFLLSAFVGAQNSNSQSILRKSVIDRPINDQDRVALGHNTRPEARAGQFETDRLSSEFLLEHLQLQLKRVPEREDALNERIALMHDPSSPFYHRWLTPQQLRQEFAPAESDIAAVTDWLRSEGFKINGVQTSGMVVDFSGTVGQVRRAFRTDIRSLVVDGRKHIANTSDPSIPRALSGVISGVVSLHDFKPRTYHKPKPQYTFDGLNKTMYPIVPADLAKIYNLNPLFENGISGEGETIVLIENSRVYNVNDWYTFRSVLGLAKFASGTLAQIHPAPASGTNNCANPGVGPPGFELEATLDAQWATAAAPSANIVLASCADTATTFGGLIALQNLINSENPPSIVSLSFGICESQNGNAANAAYYAAYQQAAAMGTSIFVAAGDSGAAGCDHGMTAATNGIAVNALASTPFNVAVGGTDFADTFLGLNSRYFSSTNDVNFGSALSYIPEIPWNSTCASQLVASSKGYDSVFGDASLCNSSLGQNMGVFAGAGGGGPSRCAQGVPCSGYLKPSWQVVLNNPSDNTRSLPDVSLFAGNGAFQHYYVVCDSNPSVGGATCVGPPRTWIGAGGTSFGAPIWAGFQALINQYVGAIQGNPNPSLYGLAAQQFGNGTDSSCMSTNVAGTNDSCIFYDVTLGDTVVPCSGDIDCYLPSGKYGVLSSEKSQNALAFKAGVGWDFATGLGTANVTNLVAAFYSRDQVPTITSPPNAQFRVGLNQYFRILTTAFPTSHHVQIYLAQGVLPSGLFLLSDQPGSATLSGTPAFGTGGSYTLQIAASNGISKANQSFTLTIDEAPHIVSPTTANLVVGQPASHIIETIGFPAAQIGVSGILPKGLSLTELGNGRAALSGTPASNAAGEYPVTVTASNGILPSASQTLNIVVRKEPVIESASSTNFVVGQSGYFKFVATGYPTPKLALSPALPSGLSFIDNGDGTARLEGVPAFGTQGIYSFALRANSDVDSKVIQYFTLFIQEAPQITSLSKAAFVVGRSGSFLISTRGFPQASIAIKDSLPNGLLFNDLGNGTALITGTAMPSTQGNYVVRIIAHNGVFPEAKQSLEVLVQEKPMIVIDGNLTFTVGVVNAFTLTSSGYPAPKITLTSSLPDGLQLVDDGNGSVRIEGMPVKGSQGTYQIGVISSNGVSPDAVERITISIVEPGATTTSAVPNNSSGRDSDIKPVIKSGCRALNASVHSDLIALLIFSLAYLCVITTRYRRD